MSSSCSGHLELTLVLLPCAVDLLRAMAVVPHIERLQADFQKPQLRLHHTALFHYLPWFTSDSPTCQFLYALAENGNKLLDLDDGSILGRPQWHQ